MPIERKILNMFEFCRNSKIAISVDNHFDEYTPSQGKSVPTDQQTVLMHQYVLIESHCKTSVALWVHPFSPAKVLSFRNVQEVPLYRILFILFVGLASYFNVNTTKTSCTKMLISFP